MNNSQFTTIIQPIEDIRFLGTDIRLSKDFQYEAMAATNQPRWKREGKVFVKYGPGEDDWTPVLCKGDYRIVRR